MSIPLDANDFDPPPMCPDCGAVGDEECRSTLGCITPPTPSDPEITADEAKASDDLELIQKFLDQNERRMSSDPVPQEAGLAAGLVERLGSDWQLAPDATIGAVVCELAANQTPPTENGWRTIETAPKDGAVVILTPGGPAIAEYEPDGCYGEGWYDGGGRFDATHWMPLPSPPVPSGGAE